MRRIGLAAACLGLAAALSAATRTVTLHVTGWTCGSCAAATRIALKKLDGVEGVQTDVEKAEAVVTYDDSKTAPDKFVQAIERIGYKASVKGSSAANSPASGREPALNGPATPETVSFFEVPLECGAAEGLGCGSASKPVLEALDRDSKVKGAKINHSGAVLAVVWKDASQATAGVAAVDAVFKEHHLEEAALRGPAREKALKEFETQRWYGASDVDRLSEYEAQVIAARLVNRAKDSLNLSPPQLAALTKDLSAGIATVLTKDKGDECARDPFEELTAIARKHLNPEQLAVLRKAADQGAGALPGEAR